MKGADHIASDWVQSRRDAPSPFPVYNPFGALWNKLWAACVPPKVKIGVWKIALDIIPTHDNLRRGESETEPYCVLCGSYGEQRQEKPIES